MVSTDGTELLTSSVSTATSDTLASDSSISPSGDQLEHIDSLLSSLPLDLTPDQRERAETFIRSYASVFSKLECRQTGGGCASNHPLACPGRDTSNPRLQQRLASMSVVV